MKNIAPATAFIAILLSGTAQAGQTFIDGPKGIRIVNVDGVLHNIVDTQDSDQVINNRYYRPPSKWPAELDDIMGSGVGASANYKLGRCRMFLRGTEAMVSMWTVVASSPKGIACRWNSDTLVPNPYDWLLFANSNPQSGLGPYTEQKNQTFMGGSLVFVPKDPGDHAAWQGGRTVVAKSEPYDLAKVWATLSPNRYDPNKFNHPERPRSDGYGTWGATWRWETDFSGGDFIPTASQQSALVSEYKAAGYDPSLMKTIRYSGITVDWESPYGSRRWFSIEDVRLNGTGTPFCNLDLLKSNTMIASAPAKFGGIYCANYTQPVVDPPVIPKPPDPVVLTPWDPKEDTITPGFGGVKGGAPHSGESRGTSTIRAGERIANDWAAWCRQPGRSEVFMQNCLKRIAR